jgi:hypothetical protein
LRKNIFSFFIGADFPRFFLKRISGICRNDAGLQWFTDGFLAALAGTTHQVPRRLFYQRKAPKTRSRSLRIENVIPTGPAPAPANSFERPPLCAFVTLRLCVQLPLHAAILPNHTGEFHPYGRLDTIFLKRVFGRRAGC